MKVRWSPLVKDASGKMGDMVFYDLQGQPVARRKGVFKDARSDLQLAHRERVKKAAQWAKAAVADPKQKAEYRAACQGHQTPYNVAFRDFMTPPEIQGIDLESYTGTAGQTLRIQARDDFEVTQLSVRIHDATGNLIEEGLADPAAAKGDWAYTSRTNVAPGQSVRVDVTAMDRPGNKTQSSRWQHFPGSV